MKKLISIIFLLAGLAAYAYDPALNETEKLYREAEKLTIEYIASFKTLRTLSAKDITQKQREDIDTIIAHSEKSLKSHQASLRTLKKLMNEYDSLSDGERSAALNDALTKNESLEVLINSLQNAIQLNKAAIESYQ